MTHADQHEVGQRRHRQPAAGQLRRGGELVELALEREVAEEPEQPDREQEGALDDADDARGGDRAGLGRGQPAGCACPAGAP